MNYSVLIQDKKDKCVYRFLQVKEEIMEEVSKEVEDPDTHEVVLKQNLLVQIDFKQLNIEKKIKINLKKNVSTPWIHTIEPKSFLWP